MEYDREPTMPNPANLDLVHTDLQTKAPQWWLQQPPDRQIESPKCGIQ